MTLLPTSQLDRKPAVPSDFKDILSKIVVQGLLDQLRDFLNKQAPDLAEEQQRILTEKIQTVIEREEFLIFLVIESTPDTITIFKEFKDIAIQGLPSFKLSRVGVAFTIERSINLIDESQPTIQILDAPYFFTIEASFERGNYKVALGGGENSRAGISFNQYRAEILWENPTFYVRAFMASSDVGGFLLDANVVVPFAIPLGPTGMGLAGIGLLYGEKFAPKKDNFTTAENAVAKLEQFKATDYVEWSQQHDLDKWIGIQTDLRVFGISTVIVEMATSGKLIRVSSAGISYLSFGPTIILGGSVAILDTIEVGRIIGAIDIRSQTLFLSAVQSMPLIPAFPDAVQLAGSLELSASLKDQSQTWMAIGGYNMNGCQVKILGFLQLEGGVRVVPFEGVSTRASARAEGMGESFGFGGGFSVWILLSATLGWNPIEVGGSLEIGGGVWVKLFGKKIGIGVSSKIDIQLPQPLLLEFIVHAELDCPWPLPSISADISIFKYNMLLPQQPAAPLNLGSTEPLSYIHGPSGILGTVTGADKNVWPDVMFVVPMQRTAKGSTLILNRTLMDGDFKEAGVSVEHHFSVLKIEKIDVQTGMADLVPEIRASWLFTANGSTNERTSQLAIPCIDPLSWLNSFDYAQPVTSKLVERLVFQTFGIGSSELVVGVPASRRFDNVVVRSNHRFWIQQTPWSKGYERGVLSTGIQVEFSIKASLDRLPVKWCDIRIVFPADQEPSLRVTNGTVDHRFIVRDIDDKFREWSFTISRDRSQYAMDLGLDSVEMPLEIVAIGYLNDMLVDIETPPLTVLTPGNYRLTIGGESSASYKGNLTPNTSWGTIVRDFTVIHPPLRPYIRYATQGDERIFGLEAGGWNPNPKGIGFGHYLDHVGLVRFRVGYLSKIYPQLWVAPQEDMSAIPVNITSCAQGTLAGSRASQEWAHGIGMPSFKEEEFTYEVPQVPGPKTIRIFYQQPNNITDLQTMVDEWSYRVSGYRNAVDHLCPKVNGLQYAFGPFGSRPVLIPGQQPTLPAAFNIDTVATASLRNGWALPESIARLLGLSNQQAGLNFLRILEWAGVFRADPAMTGQGVLSRTERTDLNLIFDGGTAPLGLLLRTNEPCDWRRTEFKLAMGTGNSFTEQLDVSICPSNDGCSCLLLARTKGIAVRIPKGEYVLYGKFNLEFPKLPRITNRLNPEKKYEEFHFTFSQPFGKSW